MKAEIIIEKIKAPDINAAMKIIKKNYPCSKWVSFKVEKDFRDKKIKDKKDYNNRYIFVAFIDDLEDIWL